MSTIDTIEYPEHFRNEIRKRIAKLLPLDESSVADSETNIPINIEKGVYNWTIQHAAKNNIVKK